MKNIALNCVKLLILIAALWGCGGGNDAAPKPNSNEIQWTGTKKIIQAGNCNTLDTLPINLTASTAQAGNTFIIKTIGNNAYHTFNGNINNDLFTVAGTFYGNCNGENRTYYPVFYGSIVGENLYMSGVDTVCPSYGCIFREVFELRKK